MTDLRTRLLEFLRAHNTMTVCTVGSDGAPQAAAVFYAADDAFGMYFISSPDSRHSANVQRSSRVAATVQADKQEWREIRGIQLEGQCREVSDAREVARATEVYTARFPFLHQNATGGESVGPVTLTEALAHHRFYLLRPTWIRLIDNTLGFGHKEELRLDDASPIE